MKKFLLTSGALVLATLATPALAAVSIPYTTNANSYSSLGATTPSVYDQITLSGTSGVFTGAGIYTLNGVTFTVGVNAPAGAAYTQTGSLTNGGTVGGNPFSYLIPYSIFISTADTITLGGNMFTQGGYNIFINPLTLASGDQPVSGVLTATVTAVPEPATWAMMLAGFGMIGFGLRRRVKQKVRVAYA